MEGGAEIEVSFTNQKTYDAEVVGTDPSTDLAVLLVDVPSRALTPLPLADSDDVTVGDPVVAIGNPFGLDRTATAGIVSALQRAVTAPDGPIDHVIQTDAPINQGSSGGPLLNARGEVIGVNSQISSPSGGGNVGIGFAVPSNTVKDVAAQLMRGGKVTVRTSGSRRAASSPSSRSFPAARRLRPAGRKRRRRARRRTRPAFARARQRWRSPAWSTRSGAT